MYNNVKSKRIFAKDVFVSNDTWVTGINNNDLLVGPAGSGKTRGYVIPNILHTPYSLHRFPLVSATIRLSWVWRILGIT